jgi:hypothetical protein
VSRDGGENKKETINTGQFPTIKNKKVATIIIIIIIIIAIMAMIMKLVIRRIMIMAIKKIVG